MPLVTRIEVDQSSLEVVQASRKGAVSRIEAPLLMVTYRAKVLASLAF